MLKLSVIIQIVGATLVSVAIGLVNVPGGLGAFGLFTVAAGIAFERDGR